MDKVISAQSYWEWFFNKHQDPEPFRSFISSDPILTKIFNFAAVPDIFSTIENNYPFDEKLAELSTITKEDIAHLFDSNIRKGYNRDKKEVSDWLDWLSNRFRLVHTTLRYYQKGKHQFNIDDSLIREETIQSFKERFSICVSGVSEDKKGKRYNWQRIGFFLQDAVLSIKVIPGAPLDNVCEVHYLRKPTKEDVLSTKKILDIGSIENFKLFRPMTDEICYGGFLPELDQDPKSTKDDKRPESTRYLVRFFYKGKELKGDEFKEFNYPIRKRHAEDLNKAKNLIKKVKLQNRVNYLEVEGDGMLNAVMDYNRDLGVPAEFWIKSKIRWLALDLIKKNIRIERTEVHPEIPDESKEDPFEIGEVGQTIKNDRDIEKRESEWLNEAEKAILKACHDDIDRDIVRLLINDEGWKVNRKENYSAIARALETSDNNIRRRLKKIRSRAEKELRKELEK
jgi:hypothetical protein